MSPRNFARIYLKQRGRTPGKAVRAIRVEAARRRLEESRERISEIAQACGFADEIALRTAFAEELGLSPRSYRDRFAI